ncbi:ATP synthase subunit I [Neisseria animalis]|uniref:F0F1 ATP synthase subunit I n=1 Tax=Neisseria animalis TaxID=492 RepID=A0A5P3MRS3_NEIAN|nr:ATP synthase subunit I [Neisseria animalis]QEY23795.1 F0F1 ATP synthase subunit I [Neisseria animalis]ROW31433.1 F0F1 ATP synthase subunit I [Neisseria animalis]VEE09733.1 ATP synthase I [Neisseria animalis]
MTRILISQAGVLFAISILSALFAGGRGFWSALAGGLTYLIPTLIAVLLLKLFKNNPYLRSRMMVVGEVLKITLSLVLMLAVFAVWHDSLAFLPFFCGLLGVSHLVFLVLLRVKDYGR